MKKTGRPSKFNGIDLSRVEILAKRGWTDADMAVFFGVCPKTWANWKDEHPTFLQALKDWKIEADARVERSLYERATGYSHPEDKIFNNEGKPLVVPTIRHYPPDTTACIFWLKNRQPERWRDRTEVEHGLRPCQMTLLDYILRRDAEPPQEPEISCPTT